MVLIFRDVRIPEVVRVRGANVDSVYRKRASDFWMYPVFGLHGATYFLGVSEWLTAALLFWGFWNKKAGVLGALLSVGTFIATVTTIPFMPDGWNAEAGFPAMQGNVAFLMKDVVLLAASFYLLKQDVLRASASSGVTSLGASEVKTAPERVSTTRLTAGHST